MFSFVHFYLPPPQLIFFNILAIVGNFFFKLPRSCFSVWGEWNPLGFHLILTLYHLFKTMTNHLKKKNIWMPLNCGWFVGSKETWKNCRQTDKVNIEVKMGKRWTKYITRKSHQSLELWWKKKTVNFQSSISVPFLLFYHSRIRCLVINIIFWI